MSIVRAVRLARLAFTLARGGKAAARGPWCAGLVKLRSTAALPAQLWVEPQQDLQAALIRQVTSDGLEARLPAAGAAGSGQ